MQRSGLPNLSLLCHCVLLSTAFLEPDQSSPHIHPAAHVQCAAALSSESRPCGAWKRSWVQPSEAKPPAWTGQLTSCNEERAGKRQPLSMVLPWHLSTSSRRSPMAAWGDSYQKGNDSKTSETNVLFSTLEWKISILLQTMVAVGFFAFYLNNQAGAFLHIFRIEHE